MSHHSGLTLRLSLAFALAFTASCGGANPSSFRAHQPALSQPGGAEKPANDLAFVGQGAGARRIDAARE